MMLSDELDVTPTPHEVDDMALLLEGAHGWHAREVAEFFEDLHATRGDIARAWAWASVVANLERRALDRSQPQSTRRPVSGATHRGLAADKPTRH